MAVRRTIWLSVQILCVVFYWAYREWLSWLLLMTAVWLPWISLVLSLPAIFSCKVQLKVPEAVTRGQEARGTCIASGPLPLPRFQVRLAMGHSYSGREEDLPLGGMIPTDHCGSLTVWPKKLWVQDYMGLFRIPVKSRERAQVLVRPVPVEMEQLPDLRKYMGNAWRPKAGGGFSENHELREYRPGDSLRQIHWKLSAKTGTYIIRESMETARGAAVVTMELSGTPEILDQKLGKLLWLSSTLVEKYVTHEIHCFTGNGMEVFPVARDTDVTEALDALLTAPPMDPAASPRYGNAAWRCHIGGDADA